MVVLCFRHLLAHLPVFCQNLVGVIQQLRKAYSDLQAAASADSQYTQPHSGTEDGATASSQEETQQETSEQSKDLYDSMCEYKIGCSGGKCLSLYDDLLLEKLESWAITHCDEQILKSRLLIHKDSMFFMRQIQPKLFWMRPS